MSSSNFEEIFTKKKTSILGMLQTEPEPMPMIIPDLIPKTSIILLAAAGGTSKSYLCLQLAISVVTNRPFLDFFDPEEPRRVLIVSGEDDKNEVHRRLKNTIKAMPEPLTEEEEQRLKNGLRIAFTHNESDFVLYSTKNGTNNADRIIKFCTEELKHSPEVIILDNLTVFHDADHNSTDLATGMMRELKKIHHQTGATIILIAHTNKSSQEGNLHLRLTAASVLGSAAFSNNARQVISMTQVTENDKIDFNGKVSPKNVVALKISKSNCGTLNKDILFLERNQNGVLKYIEPVSLDPRIEAFNVIDAIKKSPNSNKTVLVDTLRQERKMSKNAASNLIQKLQTEKLIDQKETGANNSKTFKVTKAGEALYEEVSEKLKQNKDEEFEEPSST